MPSQNNIHLRRVLNFIYFLPYLHIVVFVVSYAWDIPRWDGSAYVREYLKFESGENSFWDLIFYFHLDHFYGLPTTLYTFFAKYLSPDFRLMVGVSCLSLIAMALLLVNKFKEAGLLGWKVFFLVPLMMFNFRQYDNLIYGLQMGFVASVFFAVFGAYFSNQAVRLKKSFYEWSAGLCLVLGSLCGAFAPAIFAAIVFPLLNFKSMKQRISVWAMFLFMAVWMLGFFYIRKKNEVHIQPGEILTSLAGFFVVLGSPLTENRDLSLCLGIILFIAFLCFSFAGFRKKASQSFVFTFSIGIFSISSAALIAIGRPNLGGINPTRYVTFAIPLLLTLYFEILRRGLSNKRLKLAGQCLALILLGTLLRNIYIYQTEADGDKNILRRTRPVYLKNLPTTNKKIAL